MWTPYGPSVTYDIARGEVADLRDGTEATLPSFTDAAMPGVEAGFHYLVRATNECGSGPWQGSGGVAGVVCP